MGSCPRCGSDVAVGQEYCLGCGARLPGRGAVPGAIRHTSWTLRAAGALAVAVVAAALAVAAGNGGSGSSEVAIATGGFATVPTTDTLPSQPEVVSARIVDWPAGEDGWTIVLASFPQTEGRRPAVTRAQEARKHGLRPVGVLDSSSYASLHPGYWVVFTGVYASEAEATSALGPARLFVRSATVRRIVR